MRTSFFRALEDFSGRDTFFITGDLGFGVVEGFKKKFPRQFINAGVAEQNMMGIASGLALSGKKVIVYSIANFTTLRPLEQIRNDIAYHNLDIAIVSVGGGLAYGVQGISHHATEDLAIMRSIPNMKVFAPGDTREAYAITCKIIREKLGPVYLRLGRAGEATIHSDSSIRKLVPGKGCLLADSKKNDIALLSTGGMLETAMEVNSRLKEKDIESSVYSFHTIKPIDTELVRKIFREFRFVFSMEEHSCTGGFGSALLESLAGASGIKLENYTMFALPSEFTSRVGDQVFLRDVYGISPGKIFSMVLQKLGQ